MVVGLPSNQTQCRNIYDNGSSWRALLLKTVCENQQQTISQTSGFQAGVCVPPSLVARFEVIMAMMS
jgi:hypothetical protein